MTNKEMILSESRNYFQEKGVLIQFGARNMKQAIDSYNNSCLRCSMSHSCNGKECAVTKAFLANTERFHKEIKKNPTLRQEVEWALEC